MSESNLRRDPLWQQLYPVVTDQPESICLYYRLPDGVFTGLPLLFAYDSPQYPRLYLGPEQAGTVLEFTEPNRRRLLATLARSSLLTLHTACRRWFAALAGSSPAPVRNAYRLLYFRRSELVQVWPQLPLTEYLPLETVVRHAMDLQLSSPGQVAEKEAAYGSPKRVRRPAVNPLNLILYGPPGTGKTYHSVSYAVALVEGRLPPQIMAEPRARVQERYARYLDTGQIAFITFHQSYAYEDFVQGLRPESNAEGGLRFRLTDGLFKKVADQARLAWRSWERQYQQAPLPFAELLERFLVTALNPETGLVEIPSSPAEASQALLLEEMGETEIRYRWQTRSGRLRPAVGKLLIQKLKNYFESNRPVPGAAYRLVSTALRQFVQQAPALGESPPHYVLIIDEINRANLSRVFGELITLLEEDKRLGQENQLTALLPSGESFGVPPNLYVLGTMNTADKSIALLDAALRRRFAFVPFYPDYEPIPVAAPVLRRLNALIRERKGPDYQIGQSFFIGKTVAELPEVFNHRIVPLLYEYFGNGTAVAELLQAASLSIEEAAHGWTVTSAPDAPV